jgi:hypothetical protein
MVDALTKMVWYGWPVVSATVFALTMRRLASVGSGRRAVAAVCFSVASGVTLLALALSLVLRDGLAPGFVPTTGTTALVHALETLARLAVPALVIVVPLLGLGWWASRTSNAAADPPGRSAS